MLTQSASLPWLSAAASILLPGSTLIFCLEQPNPTRTPGLTQHLAVVTRGDTASVTQYTRAEVEAFTTVIREAADVPARLDAVCQEQPDGSLVFTVTSPGFPGRWEQEFGLTESFRADLEAFGAGIRRDSLRKR
jgi:hypothetical protein